MQSPRCRNAKPRDEPDVVRFFYPFGKKEGSSRTGIVPEEDIIEIRAQLPAFASLLQFRR